MTCELSIIVDVVLVAQLCFLKHFFKIFPISQSILVKTLSDFLNVGLALKQGVPSPAMCSVLVDFAVFMERDLYAFLWV